MRASLPFLTVPVLLLPVLLAAACSERSGREGAEEARRPSAAEAAEGPSAEAVADVRLPRVHDDNKSLLFYFQDERGAVKTTASAAEVPPSLRERVLVVDVSKTPEQRQAHRYNYFADLTEQAPDGSYAVIAVSRYDAAKGEGLAGTLAAAPEGSVVVYSAEWCGFCKKAKAWLAKNEVPFVERDVEKQPGVQRELEEKLKRANIRGGGVPVIDWAGTVVMGFDQKRLTQLLDEQRAHAGGALPAGH